MLESKENQLFRRFSIFSVKLYHNIVRYLLFPSEKDCPPTNCWQEAALHKTALLT